MGTLTLLECFHVTMADVLTPRSNQSIINRHAIQWRCTHNDYSESRLFFSSKWRAAAAVVIVSGLKKYSPSVHMVSYPFILSI